MPMEMEESMDWTMMMGMESPTVWMLTSPGELTWMMMALTMPLTSVYPVVQTPMEMISLTVLTQT